MTTDLDKFCRVYRDLLVDIADRTTRVNIQTIKDGVLHAFEDISAMQAKEFAHKCQKAFQHCLEKSKSVTSCKKLPPATAAVVKVLLKTKKKREADRINTSEKRKGPAKAKSPRSTKKAGGAAASVSSKKRKISTPAKGIAKDTVVKPLFQSPSPQKVAKEGARSPLQKSKSGKLSVKSEILPLVDQPHFYDPILKQEVAISPSGQARPLVAQTPSKNKGVMRKPSASSPAGVRKKPASSSDGNTSVATAAAADQSTDIANFEDSHLTKVSKVTTEKSKPTRSYVQATTADGRRRLIVEFASKHFPLHQEMASEAVERINKDNLIYRQARALKEEIVKKYKSNQ